MTNKREDCRSRTFQKRHMQTRYLPSLGNDCLPKKGIMKSSSDKHKKILEFKDNIVARP